MTSLQKGLITMGKTLALIMGMVMLGSVITACGDKNSSSQAEKNTELTDSSTDGFDNDHDKDGDGFYNDDDKDRNNNNNNNNDNNNVNDNNDSMNGVEKIITGARDAVDSVIDEGSELVDDAVDDSSHSTTAATAATRR